MTIDIFVLVLFIVACVRIAVLTRRLAAVTDRSWRTIAGLQRELARTDSVMEIERDRLCKMLGIPHYYALPARIKGLLAVEAAHVPGTAKHYLDAEKGVFNGSVKVGQLITKGDGTVTVRIPEQELDINEDNDS